jgi:hypothetical protein
LSVLERLVLVDLQCEAAHERYIQRIKVEYIIQIG